VDACRLSWCRRPRWPARQSCWCGSAKLVGDRLSRRLADDPRRLCPTRQGQRVHRRGTRVRVTAHAHLVVAAASPIAHRRFGGAVAGRSPGCALWLRGPRDAMREGRRIKRARRGLASPRATVSSREAAGSRGEARACRRGDVT